MSGSIVQQEPIRAAGLPHTGPYYLIGAAFGRLQPVLEGAGLGGSGRHLIAVFYDDPAHVAAAALQSDAGVILASDEPVPAGAQAIALEGGKFLTARHTGSYRSLPESWAALVAELGPRGLTRRRGPGYEIYRNTPMTAPEAELVTDIFVPVS